MSNDELLGFLLGKINKVAKEVADIKFEVVSELPTTGKSKVIYFVPHEHSTTDAYDEYVWIESSQKFEKVGSTDIDLSNYATKTYVDTAIQGIKDTLLPPEGYSYLLVKGDEE